MKDYLLLDRALWVKSGLRPVFTELSHIAVNSHPPPMVLQPLAKKLLIPNFNQAISSCPNLCPIFLHFSNLSQASIYSSSPATFLCFLPPDTSALPPNEWPSHSQGKSGIFFSSINTFNQLSSLCGTFFFLNPHVN